MASREHEHLGCKRAVLHPNTAMPVWAEGTETGEPRQFLFQGAGTQTAADPSQTVPCMFTAPTQAVLLAGVYLPGWALHCCL